jgi:mannitol-specific phosphotransferase system IIBC component
MKANKVLAVVAVVSLMISGINAQAHEAEESMAGVSATAKPMKAKVKKSSKKRKTKKAAAAKKEHWVCPMHDGGESDHAGPCPKCGMDLVKEDAK